MLNKIFENPEDKNKAIAGIVMILIALIIAITNAVITGNQKDTIDVNFKMYAKTYYEKGFYDEFIKSELNGDSQALEDYTSGFEFSAAKIFAESNIDPNEFFKKNGKVCNLEESMATIYPFRPYGSKDYVINIDIVC